MVLRMQVEEVEKVKINLSTMVGRVRLSAKLHIALFVAIEDVRGGAESWEDLTQLIMLVRFVEACGDLVHGRHWATRSHVDPES